MSVDQGASRGASTQPAVDPRLYGAMKWRLIGPFRGGRVVAVAGHPSEAGTFYFGACAGGVWKTTDAGTTWLNVSDGFFKASTVGALAVAESDPNVVYTGMGETTIRGNVMEGDGVYRSSDGGKSWQHVGLADSRAIGEIRIHPHDPDLVYVAALGHIFGPNEERGVFRSGDGGKTWEKILYRGPDAGAVDLSMDPTNPRVLYASIWEARREAHTMTSGGEGSGLFRSTDGGDTWEDISRKPGLPKGVLGKIGVSASGARPGRVWALVEAEDGALYRSDDYGENWIKLDDDPALRQRPWYYMHVFADPADPETVYVQNLHLWKSNDGGRRFTSIPTPHGDNHDLWIDPRNPRRMIESNDGGACVSFNGGDTWSTIYNQPTAQFYHVVTDGQVPYRVYGAQQDNTTLSGPSRSDAGAIVAGDWYPIGGGESGYIAVRPDEPNVVYAGSYGGLLTRYDHRTHQSRNIMAWPENHMGWSAKDLRYRFQWTYPIVLSPHDPNVLYVCSNHVHRTTSEGQRWDVISPDLTRNEPGKQGPSGGPITRDNTSVEYYGTIFAFTESPLQRGVIWVGSDDGLIHVSRDRGATWQNVTPPADLLPEWALVSLIEPSPYDAATAYVAATRYKLDDRAPYLYKTSDYGKTWTKITAGIPDHDFTRAVRADPERPGLLYAGTENGLYVSFDDGGCWQSLQLNLPVTAIHDLTVKGNDLVAATHGRAFWILDDLSTLRQVSPAIAAEPAHLFAPQPVVRYRGGFRRFPAPSEVRRDYVAAGGSPVITYRASKDEQIFLDAGQNPPAGAVVGYWLEDAPEGEVRLTFLDGQGKEIRSFSSEKPADVGKSNGHNKKKQDPVIPKQAGANRFVWDLRYPDAHDVDPPAILWAGSTRGPLAVPGHYQVRLTVGDQTLTQPFEVIEDPRVTATQQELEAQFQLLLRIRDKLSETHDAVNQIRALRTQAEDWSRRAAGQPNGEQVVEAAKALAQTLTTVEEELIQVKSKEMEDPLNFPIRLNNKLAALGSIVDTADAQPTDQAQQTYAELASGIDQQLGELREVLADDVARFNALVREVNLPALALPPAGA